MKPVSIQVQSVLYGNQKSALRRALESLANAIRLNRRTRGEVGDVTVCYGEAYKTNTFTDEEVAAWAKDFADAFTLRYVLFGENTGTAKGHNRLAKDCESDFLMIMNPDVIVCPRFFAGMLAPFFDETSAAGMTEARQTPVEHPKEYDKKTWETEWATTACAIFPTSVYREVGGFDEQTFFMYCDDLDFSWRVRLLGKKIYYRPDSVVFHAKTLSPKGGWQPTNAEVYYSAEAAILMAYKWSNNPLCKQLLHNFSHSSDETLRRAAKHFEDLREKGQLPAQIDPEHTVARFVDGYYTDHRFIL